MGYDPGDSRLTGMDYNGALPNVTYRYDLYGRLGSERNGTAGNGTYILGYGYDDGDRLTVSATYYTDLLSSSLRLQQDYFYNPDGSLQRQTLSGFTGGATYTFSYTYNEAGELKAVTTPWSNTPFTYTYRPDGLLTSQTLARTSAYPLITEYEYDGRGELTSLTNRTRTVQYDSNGNVIVDGSGVPISIPVTLSQFQNLIYDPVGNRLQTDWNVPYVKNANNIAESRGLLGSIAYSYDGLDRLARETDTRMTVKDPHSANFNLYFTQSTFNPNGTNVNSYAADEADNLTTFRSGPLGYNADNQLLLQNGSYDGEGNPSRFYDLNGNAATPTFDVENRLTGLGSLSSFGYRDDGLRAWKQTPAGTGSKFYYLYSGTAVIAEVDSTGKATNLFAYGAAGLTQRRGVANSSTFEYTFDPSGNLVQRHLYNNASAADFTCLYDAFGQQLGCLSVNQGMTFTSQDMVGFSGQFGGWTDNETDAVQAGAPRRRFPLVRMGYRDYAPLTGRFVERDPIDYAGGINLYAYAGNNPITHADPSGLIDIFGFDFTLAGTVEGVKTGLAATGNVLSGGMYDGGRFRNNPGFETSRKFAIVADTASTLSGLGGVAKAITRKVAVRSAAKLLKTGTVWDAIKGINGTFEGLSVSVPKSFKLVTDAQREVFVTANAMEHLVELLKSGSRLQANPASLNMTVQAYLTSLRSAVNVATKGGIVTNKKIYVDGWELIFRAPRAKGELPALAHALMK